MLVSQILKEKGTQVHSCAPGDTVAEAARSLTERGVGALVVVGPDGAVAGIVSERDVVRLVALRGADALAAPVCDCMTTEVHFAGPEETVDALMERMTDRRIRHLPVCHGGDLAGIVSIGDLVKRKIAESEAEAEGLKAYIAQG